MNARSSHGTSHLQRHLLSTRCAARSEERRRQVVAALPGALVPPRTANQEVWVAEEPWWFVNGVDVPRLYDYLRSEGLEHIHDHSGGAAVASYS